MTDLLSRLIEYEKKLENKLKDGKFRPGISDTKISRLFSFQCGAEKLFCQFDNNYGVAFEWTLPIIFSPAQAYELIGELNDREEEKARNDREEEKARSILDASKGNLYNGMMTWLKKNPYSSISFLKMIQNKEWLKKWEDAELGFFSIRNEELEDSTLYDFFSTYKGFFHSPQFFPHFAQYLDVAIIRRQVFNSLITSEDLFIMMLRDELEIDSLKEIDTIQSAICYLIYKLDWVMQYYLSDTRGKGTAALEAIQRDYIAKVVNTYGFNQSINEYFRSNNGFEGEMWPTYDEFLHEEWLIDETEENISDSANRSLYKKLRISALSK